MKINVKYSACVAIIAAAVGCSSAEDPATTPPASTRKVLHATVEGNDSATRVGFDEEGTFFWSQNDRIAVVDYNRNNIPFAITNGVGTGSADFVAEKEGWYDDVWVVAVYPYSSNHYMGSDGATLMYYLPDSYIYKKVDTDFFAAEQGEGNSFNPAMIGYFKDDNTVEFQHLGGVFCIKVEELPQGDNLKFVFSTDKMISGQSTVTLFTEEIYSLENCDNDGPEVTIHFSNDNPATSGVFYIPVAPDNYNDIQVKIVGADGTVLMEKECDPCTIERCDLKKIIIE